MAKLNKISLEELKKVAEESYSASEMLRKLGLSSRSSSMITNLRKLVISKNIGISHWTNQSWSKGKTALDDERVRRRPIEKIFCENSNAAPSYVRTLILKKNLLERKCSKEKCNNLGEWLGEPLVLQLDHINGVRADHRLENLRWLCPNCHSQTDTYGGKNKTLNKVSDDKLLEALKNSRNIHQALIKVGLLNGRNYKRAKNLAKKHNIGGLVEPADTRASNTREGQILHAGATPVSATNISVVYKQCNCGEKIFKKEQKYCSLHCSHKANIKISWPSLNELEALVKEDGYSSVGRKLGVSDNAVRKHLTKYGRVA